MCCCRHHQKARWKVWGVVYDIPDYLIGKATAKAHNRKSLDAIEGEGTNYKQEFIDGLCRTAKL